MNALDIIRSHQWTCGVCNEPVVAGRTQVTGDTNGGEFPATLPWTKLEFYCHGKSFRLNLTNFPLPSGGAILAYQAWLANVKPFISAPKADFDPCDYGSDFRRFLKNHYREGSYWISSSQKTGGAQSYADVGMVPPAWMLDSKGVPVPYKVPVTPGLLTGVPAAHPDEPIGLAVSGVHAGQMMTLGENGKLIPALPMGGFDPSYNSGKSSLKITDATLGTIFIPEHFKCELCNKPVDEVRTYRDHQFRRFNVRFRCHGREEQRSFDECVMTGYEDIKQAIRSLKPFASDKAKLDDMFIPNNHAPVKHEEALAPRGARIIVLKD